MCTLHMPHRIVSIYHLRQKRLLLSWTNYPRSRWRIVGTWLVSPFDGMGKARIEHLLVLPVMTRDPFGEIQPIRQMRSPMRYSEKCVSLNLEWKMLAKFHCSPHFRFLNWSHRQLSLLIMTVMSCSVIWFYLLIFWQTEGENCLSTEGQPHAPSHLSVTLL